MGGISLSPRGLELIEQYKIIHGSTHYGAASSKKARYITPYINFPVNSLLDYGCGRSNLADELAKKLGCERIYRYDPSIPNFSSIPEPRKVDLVLCTEVLEHVLECDVPSVLRDIKSISEKCFFGVSTRIAEKILPNGTNAHVTVKPVNWWIIRIGGIFDMVNVTMVTDGEGFHAKTW